MQPISTSHAGPLDVHMHDLLTSRACRNELGKVEQSLTTAKGLNSLRKTRARPALEVPVALDDLEKVEKDMQTLSTPHAEPIDPHAGPLDV